MGRKTRKPKTHRKALWDVEKGDVIYDPATNDTAVVNHTHFFGGGKRFPKKVKIVYCQKASDGIHCTVSGGQAMVVDVVGEEK